MNRPADFHIHTFFSEDSDESPDNIIAKAISLNLKCICFTDHNDYDWPVIDGKKEFSLDYPSYTKYMEKLKFKYKDIFPVYIGVEQGLSQTSADLINNYDQDNFLDFIIGSSHLVYGADPYEKEFWTGRDIDKSIRDYYESIIENLMVCNNFDVYGHLDYITRYIPDKTYKYDPNKYMEIIEVILKKLIENGKGIELNTAGLKCQLNAANPDTPVLKLYRQLGGEIITVGSDAHKADDVGKFHDKAYTLLKEAGFNYYTIFKRRHPEFIPL